MDYTFITDRLAVGGGISTEADVEALKAAGITAVIDMRAEFDDRTVLENSGLEYLYLPQQDDGTPRNPGQYVVGFRFALSSLAVSGKVFCHCAAGMNRGPLMLYAVLRAFGLGEQESVDRIKSKRPVVTFYTIQNYMDSVNSLFPKD